MNKNALCTTQNLSFSEGVKRLFLTGDSRQPNTFYIATLLVAVFIVWGCKKPGDDSLPPATLATITISAVNTITQTTALSGGNITADGGASITARGVCWSTTTEPTISNSKTIHGSGTGSFSSTLNGLSSGIKYFIRAYATNNAGTVYSNEESFTTQQVITLPVLTTATVSIITQTSAQGGGDISADGGAPVTARGLCWSATTGPTTSNSKTIEGSGIGGFNNFVTGLSPNTIYYVRAYATNSAGTAYGNEIIFTTQPISANTVTDIDGNVYNTVSIGTQVWMAENLKTTHYRNGEPIPTGLSNEAWFATGAGAYAIYENTAANNTAYGKLYNWFAVVDSRNLAPAGWHVPSFSETVTLTSFLGGLSTSGGSLKEAGLTHWISPNTGATNSSGFNGLPGGNRNDVGVYNFIGFGGYWWTRDEDSPGSATAEARGLFANSIETAQISGSKHYGISVRCIKD